MKINNPNKLHSQRILESYSSNLYNKENIWDALEKHNKTYKDNLKIVYNADTFEPKVIR